jgi:hypothetical protein
MATHPVAGSTHKRNRHLKGALDADRERRLRDLTGWTWGRKADLWEEGFRQLLRYYERHGHARMVSYTIDGHKLGVGVNTQLFSEPEPPRIWYASTTNFAVTLPSTPADHGAQRRPVTNAYWHVAGIHE